ncbi:sensor histidine kinase [Nocardioides lianchengensis]|uniref:histidine kinase n=1 Tax=Nocardioides lianchengensis TaxID=1045774 RepID=A0A1G6ZZP7_9ACTN|nr:histidine kinase [Nocardioides lianchengensis]NYG12291.1 signal transduction histidine kinase [Nocardioides lianchengensis]SDE07853.1 Signal transduction histidine kinase [Nocardioides lianchengensis]
MAVSSAATSDARPTWRPHLVDTARALAVLATTLVGRSADDTLRLALPSTWIQCLVFVTAAFVLVARRLPLVALGATAVLDALPFWLDIGGAGYHLALMIAVYVVVAHEPSRQARRAFGLVLVLQVVLMAWDMGWRWNSMFVVLAALSVTFPAALGLAARSRSEATEALRQRAVAAERSRDADARQLLAEDRLRTARDLHDSVAHQIAVMNLNAGVASRSLRERPDDAELALVTVREAGRAVISSISDLLTSLREASWHDVVPRHDLADLRVLVDEFGTLLPGLSVSYDDAAPDPTQAVDPVLYAVVREALTNAYKHGRHEAAVDVRVRLGRRSSCVRVTNASLDRSPTITEGFGLRGMRERVVEAGGRLSATTDGDHFTLEAEVPGSGEGP